MESDIFRSARRMSPCLNHFPGVNNANVRLLDSTPDSITRVYWNSRFRGTRSATRLRWRLNVVANVGTHATPVFLLRLVATSALAIHYIKMMKQEDNSKKFVAMSLCWKASMYNDRVAPIGETLGTIKRPPQSRKWGEEASLQSSSTKSSVRCLPPHRSLPLQVISR
jgi:hypothetical protein